MLTRFANAFIHSPGVKPGVTSPRASATLGINGPRRAGRVANPASVTGATMVARAQGSKAGRPGSTTNVTSPKSKDRRSVDEKYADQERDRKRKQDREEQDLDSTASTSRFAHWADVRRAPAAAAARQVDADPCLHNVPSAHGMRATAIRQAIVNGGGRMPGCKTPEQTAAFILAAGAKARGQKVPAMVPGVSAASLRTAQDHAAGRFAECDTPEKMAAFIDRAAAKARGK